MVSHPTVLSVYISVTDLDRTAAGYVSTTARRGLEFPFRIRILEIPEQFREKGLEVVDNAPFADV